MPRRLAFAFLAVSVTASPVVQAAPSPRVQIDQHGDFLLIGNTLGFECAAGTPAPVVGTVVFGACNQTSANVNDSAPDLFWRADSPGPGMAEADQSVTPAQARSTAVLALPAGATVTHAFLYWAGASPNNTADPQVLVERPGAGGFTQTVTAVQSFVPCVQCLADGDCGGPTSGAVCDPAMMTCGSGCRGAGGNGCAPGLFCTSMDMTAGACVGCLGDPDCGGPTSGAVCDAIAAACASGCRGQGGNGCPVGARCTSTDMTIGACVACLEDADCGGAGSGRVCDMNTCADGCRGMGGNGCAAPLLCTSTDGSIGACVACLGDADCGGAASGRVCEAGQCAAGCRGSGGNGCPPGERCTSADATAGTCQAIPPDLGAIADLRPAGDSALPPADQAQAASDAAPVEGAAPAEGCSCRVASHGGAGGGWAVLALVALGALRRRRGARLPSK